MFDISYVRIFYQKIFIRPHKVHVILYLFHAVHGGISYNYYTTATQQYQNKLADLKNSAEFDPDYISYFFGVGLQHPINKFLQVYTRYGIDRAFEFTERSDDGVNERYRVVKTKISAGFLIDLERRLRQHQQGKGANYTRKHRPVVLVYHQEFPTIQEAFRRQKQIQGWSHAKKQALIDGDFDKLTSTSSLRQAQ